jgi:aryl-alcohol dehydrogenase-like predicted oxidoreductase
MQYRDIGTSGVQLSALTFGAWGIGDYEGGVTAKDAIAALHAAHGMGFTSIDTGRMYGLGYSEAVVGEAIRTLPRDKVQISTKCGVVWEGDKGQLWYPDKIIDDRKFNIYRYSGKESIMKECEDSLRRLGTDYIDLYSVHWPDATTPIEEPMEAFSRLKEQGKIRAAGLCNRYSVEEIKKADEVTDVAFLKVRYSMLNRVPEKELIPYCLQNNKSIIAYHVLQRGILTGRDLPKFLWAKDDRPFEVALYDPGNIRRIRAFLEKLTPIAMDNGATVTQLVIRWLINRPGVAVGLLGASSPEQVAYDAKAMDILLSAADTDAINHLLAELEKGLELEVKEAV